MAKKYEKNPMPGYTHLQRAMPSSWGLWFASYAESFIDNIDLINTINKLELKAKDICQNKVDTY